MKRRLLWLAAWAIAACPFAASAAAEADWIAGQVIKVDTARGRVTLDHAPIRSVGMAAMTMPFAVVDAALLTHLKVGAKVRFSVVLRDDELLVSRIEVMR